MTLTLLVDFVLSNIVKVVVLVRMARYVQCAIIVPGVHRNCVQDANYVLMVQYVLYVCMLFDVL